MILESRQTRSTGPPKCAAPVADDVIDGPESSRLATKAKPRLSRPETRATPIGVRALTAGIASVCSGRKPVFFFGKDGRGDDGYRTAVGRPRPRVESLGRRPERATQAGPDRRDQVPRDGRRSGRL